MSILPRRLALVALLVASTTACFGGAGGGKGGYGEMGSTEKMGKKPEPVTVVELDEARTGAVADVLAASAVVESEAAADIIPLSTGIVVSLHKDEGDPVKKGDLLAVLDNVSLDASAERAASDLRRIEDQYAQMERLASQGAVSDRELSDLRYQLEGARTSMREASRTKGQTRLTAPFDGVVARRDVRVGQLAGSSAAAFQVVDLGELRVVASLPERDLQRVAVGQTAVLTSAYDTERKATGRIARIAPVVDANSGTFRVTVTVDPDQTVLRPGQFVSVDLEVDRRTDVVVVPRKAIVYEDGAPVVYVYDEPTEEELAKAAEKDGGWGGKGGKQQMPAWVKSLFGGGADEDGAEDEDAEDEGPSHVARRTPVKLGLVDSEVAQVLEGVEVGDRLIVVGQSHLRDGAKVRDAAEAGAAKGEKAANDGSDGAEQEADAGSEGGDGDHG